jgi:hypothetical protein
MPPRRRAAIVILAAVALLAVGGAPLAQGALVINDTSFNASSGVNLTVNGSVTANTGDLSADDQVALKPRLRVRGGPATSAEVRNLSGDYFTLTNVAPAADRVRAIGGAGHSVIVRSSVDNVTFRRTIPAGSQVPFEADDGVVDFIYADTTASTADITLRPVAANRQLCAVDAATATNLDCARSSGTGVVRFDSLTLSSHRVLLQFGQAPNLNDTSASPQPPDEYVDDRQTSLAINATDRDFPNETVTVEFYLNGNSQGTDTLTSEGRVSVSGVTLPPGRSEWYAVANDSDGLIDRSQNFTVTSPGFVTVKNNNNNNDLTNETVTAEFYTNSGIETKTTNNGEIDMLNLPNQDMRVDFSANNFSARSFQFFGIDENKTVYMQPVGSGFSTITFTLNDETGQYPPVNTTLIIEESKSGNWTTIASERFGSVNEVTTDLDPSVTYRLRVRNENGDTQVLRTYSPPSNDASEELVVDESVSTPPGGTGYTWSAEYRANQSGGNDTIRFAFTDPQNETTDLRVAIYERGNRTNNTIFADNFTGPHGTVVVTQDVPPNQENRTWVVNATADRNGQIQRQWQLRAGQNPLDFGLAPNLRAVAGVILLLLMGYLFGGVSSVAGGIVIPLAALLLWYIDWLPTEVGIPAIIAALFIGVVNSARSRGDEVV